MRLELGVVSSSRNPSSAAARVSGRTGRGSWCTRSGAGLCLPRSLRRVTSVAPPPATAAETSAAAEETTVSSEQGVAWQLQVQWHVPLNSDAEMPVCVVVATTVVDVVVVAAPRNVGAKLAPSSTSVGAAAPKPIRLRVDMRSRSSKLFNSYHKNAEVPKWMQRTGTWHVGIHLSDACEHACA